MPIPIPNVNYVDWEELAENAKIEHRIAANLANLVKKVEPPKEPAFVEKVLQPEYHKELILICGIPGSGKSTLSKYIRVGFEHYFDVPCVHLEADKFFVSKEDGIYRFDPSKLQQAHEWCQNEAKKAMEKNYIKVIVSNTSINKRQREPYIRLAKQYGYLLQTIICRGQFESIHAVPAETIRRMSQAFEF